MSSLTGVVLFVGIAAGAVLADDTPLLTAPLLAQAPVDWSQAPEVTGFRALPAGGLAAQQAFVRVAYDERALTVQFRCPVSGPARLKGSERTRDGAVWEDDAVELFLDPGRTRAHFYHLAANCRGSRYDAQDGSASWNGEWQVTAEVAAGRSEWLCTFTIPFATLGCAPPKPGGCWGANFCLDSALTQERSAWAFTGQRFEEPARFGTLAFWPEAPAVRVEGLGNLTAGKHRLAVSVTGRDANAVIVEASIRNAGQSLLKQQFLFVLAGGRQMQTAFPFDARPAGDYLAEFRARVAGGETFYIASVPITVRTPVLVSAP